MARLFRLLLLGLVLAAGAAGCKNETAPSTAPGPTGAPRHSGEIPRLIPLPP